MRRRHAAQPVRHAVFAVVVLAGLVLVQRGSHAATTTASAARPHIVAKPIPFGRKRKREMAAYARRHYGIDSYRLRNPRVIVEHYTAGTSFSSAYNTFARDTRDVELHELPGVCSHFLIDTDGTIYQLVPLGIMCRHTVGLNYTAIGIEHVGTSDGAVMGNRRVLRASLALTNWLRCTDGIRVKDVIGHSESLSSPYHMERVRRLRTQTHGDMRRASMKVYRSKLRRRGCG
jgi:beta-N-acetylhexosaminidase